MRTFAIFLVIVFACSSLAMARYPAPPSQELDPSPPAQPVKLVFIHHSTGENWLTDGYGDLGRTLDQNNYFVSDTNYGWGPDAIGDRTDIPNWVEWFASAETERYMQALFNESGQHSSFTRTLSDPGGENQIILFKSCFPNSALEGNPSDPPSSEGGLTVGHAKYVYNEILRYFATRPDKLFVVITAPPLSDPTYAANARAFNLWLLNDWLAEYPLSNVAVFDFYNVLTGRDHHHRYSHGQIEHTFNPGADTLVYPSGDDHPSEEGSRKATEEFVPLLNVFYNRWQAGTGAGPLPTLPIAATQPAPTAIAALPAVPAAPAEGADLIAAFESGEPDWAAYRDETTPTNLTCDFEEGNAYSGNASMRLDFNVAANSWATCYLHFNTPQDWRAFQGLTFYLRSGQSGLVFNVDVYSGVAEARETYIYTIESPPESAQGWIPITITWDQFHRAAWEENADAPFTEPNQVSGIAFGFNTYPDTPNVGVLWVDELRLVGGEPAEAAPQTTQPAAQEPQETAAQPAETVVALPEQSPMPPSESSPRRSPFCAGAMVLPLFLGVLWLRRGSTRR